MLCPTWSKLGRGCNVALKEVSSGASGGWFEAMEISIEILKETLRQNQVATICPLPRADPPRVVYTDASYEPELYGEQAGLGVIDARH